MMHAGIEIIDGDGIDAASDRMADAEAAEVTCPECDGRRSITDYSPDRGWINIVCPACAGIGSVVCDPNGADAWDDDPEPPTPASPAIVPAKCRPCEGTGTKRYFTGGRITEWIEERCRWCGGTGVKPSLCP